ncbi:MAG: hypothetical protein OXI66_12590, partial [Boseongicola sp.]|nr:hypothetical protein [Boseongicola sp.]
MTEPSLPFNEDFAESCQSKGMSIGGASCSASDGTIEVFNPASGQVWAKAPDATRDDARAAACLPLGETVPSDPLKTSIVERHPLG